MTRSGGSRESTSSTRSSSALGVRSARRPDAGRRRKRELEVGPVRDRDDVPVPSTSRDPIAFYAYAGAAAVTLAVVVVRELGTVQIGLGAGHIASLVLFSAMSNVLPVPAANNVYLSMSAPVNVAIALLLPPGWAGGLVAVSALSNWELKRETTLSHAAFNRVQLGLSTAAASAVFGLDERLAPVPLLALAGAATYQTLNWMFVAAAEATCRRRRILAALAGIVPGGPVAAPIYVVLAVTGVALALTFVRVGPWAIALIMFPLLAARHTVATARRLEDAERTGRALADRVITERERERARIASDIHDVVLQDLIALQLQADNLMTAVEMNRPDLVDRLAATVKTAAERAVVDLRRSINRLRRSPIEPDGLISALETHCRSFSARTGLQVGVRAAGTTRDVTPAISSLVYECAQEALNNVVKHAAARRADIHVAISGDELELRVVDDGRGLEPRLPDEVEQDGGAGLVLMREKVRFADGDLELRNRDHGGCELIVRVPLR